MGHPVERRAKVIDQFLSWEFFSDFTCEFTGFLHTWVASLNPEEVGVGGIVDSPLGRCGIAGFVVIVTFPCSRDIPRPEDGSLGVLFG